MATRRTSVTVPDAPPENVTVVVTSPYSINISWNEPVIITGPTFYLIDITSVDTDYYKASFVQTNYEDKTLNISGLRAFTRYSVVVTAFTGDIHAAHIEGKSSTSVIFSTFEAVPRDPLNNITFQKIPGEVTKFQMTFIPPSELNGNIQVYQATVYKEDDPTAFQIYNLSIMHSTNKLVYAINGAGAGPKIQLKITTDIKVQHDGNVTKWYDAYFKKPRPYFVNEGFPNPPCTQGNEGLSSNEDVYVIGADSTCMIPGSEEKICNGPLKPRKQYLIRQKQKEGGTYSPRDAEIIDTKFKLDQLITVADLEMKDERFTRRKEIFVIQVRTSMSKYNNNRVKLMPDASIPGSDYINASYVSGYLCPNEFIATQGPLPGTVGDFWRMVWETRAKTLVMLTQCFEKGRIRCHQYWPEDNIPVTVFGDIVITKLVEDIQIDWTIRDLKIERHGDCMMVRQCNFTAWPEHGVPETSTSLVHFVKLIRASRAHDSTPIVVHCSAGVGRTGVYIALDHLTQHMNDHDFVDIYGLVAELRSERMCMVQNLAQYIYLHQCVLDLLTIKRSSQPVCFVNYSVLQKMDSLDAMEGDVELEWEETTIIDCPHSSIYAPGCTLVGSDMYIQNLIAASLGPIQLLDSCPRLSGIFEEKPKKSFVKDRLRQCGFHNPFVAVHQLILQIESTSYRK
ncbi:Phosphatidylinositol phosphatase PTPRQ [Varanus komodoensis]|nr:Phosphatidylinositol phosphatase PTPRQ [Varanus komodoensis]